MAHAKLLQARQQRAFTNCAVGPSVRRVPRSIRQVTVRNAVATSAKKMDDLPLFADPVTSTASGSATTSAAAKAKATVADVPLESEAGVDYTALRDHIKEGDFRKADDETRALLIKLAGEAAEKRGWVYFSEVSTIPVKDMQTMDALWKVGSNGKFGYSVQKEIWNQNQKRWAKFFKQIDWTQGENNNYRKWPAEFTYSLDAPKGHLPLTNALRGTQLFQAVLEHPAFDRVEKTTSSSGGKPSTAFNGTSNKPLFSL